MPKISIIIPAYNCSKYLFEAINSVLKQTYQDFEIIVVDDGSTDDTREKMNESIEDRRIRYIYQDNRGPGSARNRGIEESTGEYLAFLDADDILTPSSLEKRRRLFDKYSEVSMVFSDYDVEQNDRTVRAHLKSKGFVSYFKDSILNNENGNIVFKPSNYGKYLEFEPFPVLMNTAMVRKECMPFFRTDVSVCEDIDCWWRIIRNHAVGYIDESLAYYCRNHSTLTRHKERYYLDTIKVYREIGQNENKCINRVVTKRLADCYYELGYDFFKNYQNDKARRCLLKSIVMDSLNINAYRTLLATYIPVQWMAKLKGRKYA